MTATTTHYAPIVGYVPERIGGYIAAAYAALGRTAPNAPTALQDALSAEPTIDDIGRRAAAAVFEVTDKDAGKVLAGLITDMQRAQAVAELRGQMQKWAGKATQTRGAKARAEALDDLDDDLDALIERFTGAAVLLPADPLNADAVFRADATAAYKSVCADLAALGVVASMFPRTTSGHGRVAWLLPVVDVVSVPLEEVNSLSGATLSAPSKERDQIREFIRTALDDLDLALVNVARGTYGEAVVLSVARTAAEIEARSERLDRANSARRVESWGHQATMQKQKPMPVPPRSIVL